MTETSSSAQPVNAMDGATEHLNVSPGRTGSSRLAVPLWIAAVSLAVIAVVMMLGLVQLASAVHSLQASAELMRQQAELVKKGLGGLVGG